MDRERDRVQTPMVGGSSLLVIFAVLCLTVFALLGLSTVQADKRLSDASASAVSNYYEADYQAERILAELRCGRIPEGVEQVNGTYCYSCFISNTQELRVEVRMQGDDWEVLRWQAVSTVSWSENDTLSVWDGNTDAES